MLLANIDTEIKARSRASAASLLLAGRCAWAEGSGGRQQVRWSQVLEAGVIAHRGTLGIGSRGGHHGEKHGSGGDDEGGAAHGGGRRASRARRGAHGWRGGAEQARAGGRGLRGNEEQRTIRSPQRGARADPFPWRSQDEPIRPKPGSGASTRLHVNSTSYPLNPKPILPREFTARPKQSRP